MASSIVMRESILKTVPHLEVASGDIASFQTDMVAPLKELKVHFYCQQSGSGTPSPTNIRPLSGWSGLDILHSDDEFKTDVPFANPSNTAGTNASKRIFTPGTFCAGIAYSNYFYPHQISSYSVSGGVISVLANNVYGLGYAMNLGSATTFKISADITNNGRIDSAFYASDGTFLGSAIDIAGENTTIPENTETTVIIFENRSNQMTVTFSNITVSIGSSTPVYDISNEVDKNSVLFPSAAGTVYGGYIDAVRGKLVAEWGGMRKKLSEAVQTQYSTGIARYDFNNCIPYGQIINTSTQICNVATYRWNTQESLTNHFYGYYTTTGGMKNRLLLYLLDGHGLSDDTYIEFSAPFTTPVEFDIDPITLKTLRGANNIWSNSNGEIEVKFWTH